MSTKTTHFIDDGGDCNHKWNGNTIQYSVSGQRITVYTYLKWASYTDEYRTQVIKDYHREMEYPIVEECATCSKCNKEFNPLWDIEIF